MSEKGKNQERKRSNLHKASFVSLTCSSVPSAYNTQRQADGSFSNFPQLLFQSRGSHRTASFPIMKPSWHSLDFNMCTQRSNNKLQGWRGVSPDVLWSFALNVHQHRIPTRDRNPSKIVKVEIISKIMWLIRQTIPATNKEEFPPIRVWTSIELFSLFLLFPASSIECMKKFIAVGDEGAQWRRRLHASGNKANQFD